MAIPTDTLLDRMRLKAQVMRWRGAAILLLVILGLLLVPGGEKLLPTGDYIARVTIDGLIEDDLDRDAILKSIKENNDVQALIVHINTPGGTVVGGESLYNRFKDIAQDKPVVAVMDTLATSAGYMVALGTDYVFASKGTLTGSIGVILQSADVVDLANKMGVDFTLIKSAPLKASPNPFEKITPEAREAMQVLINDFYNLFVNMVKESRKLPHDEVIRLADGRVFTGSQAVQLKLIDAIGVEDDAVSWLIENKNIKTDKVREVSLKKEEGNFNGVLNSLFFGNKKSYTMEALSLQGLLSIWVDGII